MIERPGARPEPAPDPVDGDGGGLRRGPDFILTLTRALLSSVELPRILYVILSGATAGGGLGFNRAFLWLADEGQRRLRGQLAIGPHSIEAAHRIWEAMEAERFDLERVMHRYDAFARDPQASRLARQLSRVSLPLPLPRPSADPAADPPAAPDAGGEARAADTADASGSTDAGAPASLAALFGQVFEMRQPLRGEQAPVPLPADEPALTLQRFALAPLLLEDHPIGVLAVDNAFNQRPVRTAELDDLQTLANLAAVAVERARLYEHLRRMAHRDGLTGLLNRRRFDERLAELCEQARLRDEPLSLLLVDADGFKSINDRWGHLAGDDLLRGLARLVTDRIRQGDVAARYGGDELAVLLPGASGPEALGVAETLAKAVRSERFGDAGDAGATVSIGVAELGAEPASPAALLAEADAALYEAKGKGRDRAVLRQAPAPPDR
jgi:diguanylate cyclase (GGDEF)-like protein